MCCWFKTVSRIARYPTAHTNERFVNTFINCDVDGLQHLAQRAKYHAKQCLLYLNLLSASSGHSIRSKEGQQPAQGFAKQFA